MTKTIVCGRCNTPVTLTKLVSKAYAKGNVKIQCPECKQPIGRKSELPPTMAQLVKIQQLGGSIAGIKNRGEAAVKINQLLEQKKQNGEKGG